MIVIPSLAASGDLVAVRERIDDWCWVGFQRVELVVSGAELWGSGRRRVEDLLRDAPCAVQVAGDFASGEDVETVLSAGADFAVLGARAIDEADWLAGMVSQFPGQLIVTAPGRERRVRSRGAVRSIPMDLRDAAAEWDGLRIGGLLVEFPADASIEHTDLAILEDLAEALDVPVGVSGVDADLATLRDLEFRGLAATVVRASHLSAAFDEQVLARSFVD